MELLNHISAFILPLILFIYWTSIGLAVQSVLRSQRNLMQNILLAPTIGIALTIVMVFWLSFIGNLTVKSFGVPLTLFLLVGSVSILYFKKTIFPTKRYLPFMGLFLLDLWLVGRPLASYGFDWISYSNDDMANYCLSALRFLNHGYFELPDMNQFMAGKDYTAQYWFMFVISLSRSGSELLLAWVSSITHLDPLKIFMPTIIAFNLALLSATMAMVYYHRNAFRAALCLGLVMAFSALTSLGTLYQLIAQVLGLGLLVALLTLIASINAYSNGKSVLYHSILLAILASALLVCYPEVVPFAVLALMLFILRNILSGQSMLKTMLVLLCSAGLSLLFTKAYFFNAVYFLFHQVYGNITAAPATDSFLFPYYLIPSGFANLWGFLPIGARAPEPILSITILIGGVLLLFAFVITIRSIVKKPKFMPAYTALVMLLLGLHLFHNKSDFGLFKLAMYIQAFLLATVISFLFLRKRNRYVVPLVMTGFIASNLYAQHYYLERSKALTAGSLTEVVFASNNKINKEYKQLIAAAPIDHPIITNDFNLSLLKFQMYETIGRAIGFCSFPIFNNFVDVLPDVFTSLYPHLRDISIQYYAKVHNHSREKFFNLFDPVKQSVMAFDQLDLCVPTQNTILVIDKYKRSILNRSHFNEKDTGNFLVVPYDQIHNILSFISSAKGPIYYAVSAIYKSSASFFNLEGDWNYPESSGQSLGRYLLFQVFNPTEKGRLVLNITATLKSDKTNQLPTPVVIGNKRYRIPMVGRGSARVFSEPLETQKIGQNHYIEIDMQENGKQYPNRKPGLMKLFGQNINIDQRRIVVFGRDISLLSEAEYEHLNAPASISHFPADLKDPNLEYSGIYEDGWISENAFVSLKPKMNDRFFILRGLLPLIGTAVKSNTLIVKIDGQPVYEKKILPGNFEVKVPLPNDKTSRKKIELFFSNVQSLPQGDDRPIAAKLEWIGFI